MTTRTLRLKRIYRLGDFANLEVSDEITDLPEDKAFDPDAISKLTDLQILRMETAINKYYVLRNSIRDIGPEELVELLEERTKTTIGHLTFNVIKKGE